MAEFLPGYEASGWYGVSAPKGTPPEIVARLNKDINASMTDPKTKARLAELGCLVSPGTPADYAKFVASDTEKWGKVVRTAGIRGQ
jgi:tripartite-type tricarboxylate transporter receptor subunit TctC